MSKFLVWAQVLGLSFLIYLLLLVLFYFTFLCAFFDAIRIPYCILFFALWVLGPIITFFVAKNKFLKGTRKDFTAFSICLLPFLFIYLTFGVYWMILMHANSIRKAADRRMYTDIITNDPQCPDGKFLDVDKKNRVVIVTINSMYKSFSYIGHLNNNHIILNNRRSLRATEPQCAASEQSCLGFMKQCKDRNDKTIFDNYNLIEDVQ
jgi:hypothetical protein